MYSLDGLPAKSNARPISIFSFYMVLCLSLTVLILRSLYLSSKLTSSIKNQKHYATHPERVLLFAALATISLGTTWYYMFCFFSYSYRDWASTQFIPPKGERFADLELGAWLRDTKLFKEAWGTALETPGRFWWTQQIFFWATIWSVFLGRQGFTRRIPHLWAYMLLGQVVAISFATNLFFLAVSLNPVLPTSSRSRSERWTPPHSLLLMSLFPTFITTGMIPSLVWSSFFLLLLLMPHFTLFIPPMLYGIVPQSWGRVHSSSEAVGRYYQRIYSNLVALSAIFIGLASKRAWGGISEALYEHPAVSSVGWDVIFCWMSWGAWTLVQQISRRHGRIDEGKQ